MTVLSVLDAAGAPALAGDDARLPRRPPAGQQGDALPRGSADRGRDLAVMRHTPDDRHGWRIRAMIVVLWRAGLRVQEALALAEHDLDPRRGSLLVRRGKGGRRREVGMDEWGWDQLRPWLAARTELPPGPAPVLRDRRGDPRPSVVGRGGACRVPPARRPSRCQAQVRPARAAPRARPRAGPRGRAAQHHPTPARARQPRHHLQGIDPEEIIMTVRTRRTPMMSASAGLKL
jgi:integrase